jgi:hypothetical protein
MLGFALDGIVKEKVTTASVEFQILTGYNELDNDGLVISIYADKLIDKYLGS